MLDWLRSFFFPPLAIDESLSEQLLRETNRLLQQKLIEESVKTATLQAEMDVLKNNSPEIYALKRYEMLSAEIQSSLDDIGNSFQSSFEECESRISKILQRLELHNANTFEIRKALIKLTQELLLKIAVCESHWAIYSYVRKRELRKQCFDADYPKQENPELREVLHALNASRQKFIEASIPISIINTLLSSIGNDEIIRPDNLAQLYQTLDLDVPASLQESLERYVNFMNIISDSGSSRTEDDLNHMREGASSSRNSSVIRF